MIRGWIATFGTRIAAKIRRGRSRPAGGWHVGDVVLKIDGVGHLLGRTIEANGDVLDILMQLWRDTVAA